MKRQFVKPRAPKRANPRGAFWLGWAFSTASLLAISASLFSEAVRVPDVRRYEGHFEPAAARHNLVVPAQVPLEAVLVHEGEGVVQGQRIALLNQRMLEDKIEHMRVSQEINALERDCLLNSSETPQSAIEASDALENLQAQAALRRCGIHHQAHQVSREALLRERQALSYGAHLKYREAIERLRLTEPAVQRILSLRAEIERNALRTAIAELDIAIAEQVTQQEKETLAKVISLESVARDIDRSMSHLKSFSAAPYLTAPQSGHVARLRNLPLHEAFANDTDLVQLVSELPNTFNASVVVPVEEAEMLTRGAKMLVQFSGLHVQTPPLSAKIADIHRTDPNSSGQLMTSVQIEVEVGSNLAPHAQAIVDSVRNGTGQSQISASFEDTSIKRILAPSLARLGEYF
ncbi:hypothetical protein BXY66_2444 [Shimia isoporae]|uniref:HlyD family secretion protein n=1 Tax=Shimia isoporae TaxID=647720 RepID=A0A4R1N3M1_9RHOB|nr:hypothetical protein [Shimia isoporae]TCL01135.1 hypothetical protein BXY66_2444 [Shimia isoporae]